MDDVDEDGVIHLKPTKERILDAAIDLFSRDGYTGVSVRDIARAVGIKESSLYNHFRNKDELLETIFTNFNDALKRLRPSTEALDQVLPTVSPDQFLKRSLARFMEYVADPTIGKMWRILHIEQYRNPVAREIILHELIGGTLAFLETVFAKLIAQGRIKPMTPRLLAAEYQYPIFALITEYNMLQFEGLDTGPVEQRMADHIEFFLGYVLPD